MNEAVDKFKTQKVPYGGCTMDKALSRDNAMYNISEYSNLKQDEIDSKTKLIMPLSKPGSNFSFSPKNAYLR